MKKLASITFLALTALCGCETAQPMTATQMDALLVREVEVPADRAFAAASSALLDAGYQIHVSDADAGLLTAERREDPSVAVNAALLILTAIFTRGGGAQDKPPDFYAICIEVLPNGADRSDVRIRQFLNGQVQSAQNPAARKTVQEIWTLMQRQVLMKEPAK